ncbi:MAG TPA: Uma2 family endonuclease [Gemmataceae bacterium]|jgi:Uma2 family endonuclease
MSSLVATDPARTQLLYDWAADRYLQSLPLEHFMESTQQSSQRKITLESLDLVSRIRPDFQVFSELLIQYPVRGEDPDEPARVVPDNMVIVWPEPLAPLKAFHTPLQEARPTLVMEYVSQSNPRKDYDENYKKYERDLKVPYYLVFDADKQSLVLFRLNKRRYAAVPQNESGRLAIPELDLEVAIQDGWVRYWHRGELLPLPGELATKLDATQDALRRSLETARQAEDRAETAERELARLREELAQAKGERR